METSNPYTSPQSNLFGGTAATSSDGVTQGVLLQLQKTKPWVRFMSVMMFIGAGLMLVVGLVMGIASSAGMMNQGNKAMGAGLGVLMAAIYALFSVVYIYPALKLWKYADRIRDLLNSRQIIDLEKALNEQRAFWKFVGVMMIVIFVIYFVAALTGALVVGINAAKASGKM
jgi:Family of unknown function (DUF5362)